MEHVFSSFSDWWVSSWGNITSIIYSQYLWKQSVKPGVKLCSASKIRAQGLRTCAAIVGFANWRFSLSSSFFFQSAFYPWALILWTPPPNSPCLPWTEMKQEAKRGCHPFIVPFRTFRMNYTGSGNNCLSQLWIHLLPWLSDLMWRKFPRAEPNNAGGIRHRSVSVAINIHKGNFTAHLMT